MRASIVARVLALVLEPINRLVKIILLADSCKLGVLALVLEPINRPVKMILVTVRSKLEERRLTGQP